MSSSSSSSAAGERVYLDSDEEIRGQKFVCLSFLTPDKTIFKSKEAFLMSKFLDFFALDYKVKASESFLFGELRVIQNVLSGIELALANAALAAGTGDVAPPPVAVDASGDVVPVAPPPVAASDAAPATAASVAVATNAKELLASLEQKVREAREDLAKRVPEDLEAHVKANLADFKESKIKEVWDTYMSAHRSKLEDEFHAANGYKTTMLGLKVRGSYPTHDQAAARAKALNKKDPYHNIFVGEVGEWMPWDPAPEEIDAQEYPLDTLNNLMKGHRENKDKLDAFFEEEKRNKIKEAALAASATSKKEATFGAKDELVSAAEVAREVFVDVGEADLAIARKAAATAATSAAAGDGASVIHM